MTVNVGTMQLPVTEDPDPVRTYLNGTHPSGGLWTALTRASNHDHSGGLNGVQLTATSIPDGSITTAKLDPAVLLPYALVDGSKPFTGQVALNSDAIVRDHLYFGAKPAGVADATLQRTGAGALRVDTNLGVAVNPVAWAAGQVALQVGKAGALFVSSGTGNPQTVLGHNTAYTGGAAQIALHETWPASDITMTNGTIALRTAPAVAAGAAQTFTARASLAPTGTLTLTPDAGQPALVVGTTGRIDAGAGQSLTLTAPGSVVVNPASVIFHPATDNAIYCGFTANRWVAVYAAAGAINTSTASVKEAITPLSPAECYQAAKDVRWYEYVYLPPTYQAPPDVDGEDADTKEARLDESKAAHARMLIETAPARHQRGFVFPAGDAKDEAGGTLPPVPDLFGLSDRQSTTPQADLATLGCALQEVIRRLETLEAGA